MKCSYCDKEITGYHKGDWIWFDRMPRFDFTLLDENPDPRNYAPIRKKICRECYTDMGIKVN